MVLIDAYRLIHVSQFMTRSTRPKSERDLFALSVGVLEDDRSRLSFGTENYRNLLGPSFSLRSKGARRMIQINISFFRLFLDHPEEISPIAIERTKANR